MSTLTKLLPANAAPAQTLLDKAHALPLTSAQRAELPQVIHTPEGEVELGVPADQLRPVEVNDVFVDEKGGFWAVRPAVEKVLNVTGDVNVLREAAGALVNRGVRIAQIEEGFAVLPLPNLAKMLQMVGLEVTEAESPFDPIQFKAAHGGCGCGCHDDEDSCGCGHHHHTTIMTANAAAADTAMSTSTAKASAAAVTTIMSTIMRKANAAAADTATSISTVKAKAAAAIITRATRKRSRVAAAAAASTKLSLVLGQLRRKKIFAAV